MGGEGCSLNPAPCTLPKSTNLPFPQKKDEGKFPDKNLPNNTVGASDNVDPVAPWKWALWEQALLGR